MLVSSLAARLPSTQYQRSSPCVRRPFFFFFSILDLDPQLTDKSSSLPRHRGPAAMQALDPRITTSSDERQCTLVTSPCRHHELRVAHEQEGKQTRRAPTPEPTITSICRSSAPYWLSFM